MTNTSQGQRLKSERQRLKLTQAQAADIAGVARETWGRYESGKLQPGMAVLTAFANKGADTVYILTGRNPERDAKQSEESLMQYAAVQVYGERYLEASGIREESNEDYRLELLVGKFSALDEQGRQAVEAMINALLTKK